MRSRPDADGAVLAGVIARDPVEVAVLGGERPRRGELVAVVGVDRQRRRSRVLDQTGGLADLRSPTEHVRHQGQRDRRGQDLLEHRILRQQMLHRLAQTGTPLTLVGLSDAEDRGADAIKQLHRSSLVRWNDRVTLGLEVSDFALEVVLLDVGLEAAFGLLACWNRIIGELRRCQFAESDELPLERQCIYCHLNLLAWTPAG